MAIPFLNLGFSVPSRPVKIGQASRNTAAVFLNSYIASGKLLSRDKAKELHERCGNVLDRLCQAVELKGKIRLHIIEEINPNAEIIAGSGDIVVTTGLLQTADLTGGQLAAVLAHELGHYLKHGSIPVMPKRFKNPLSQQYALFTRQAQRQLGEYQVDELGLLILDWAGYSVLEALEMAEKLAEFSGGVKNRRPAGGARILELGSTHPPLAERMAVIRKLISSPKYVWKNREAKREALFSQPLPDTTALRQDSDTLQSPSKIKLALSLADLDRIAKDTAWNEDTMVFDFYQALKGLEVPPEELKSFIGKLRQRANKGDLVARGCLQSLLTAAHFKKESLADPEETMLAILSFSESAAAYLKLEREQVELGWNADFISKMQEQLSLGCTLEEAVQALPPSSLRDQVIAGLLSVPCLLEDRDTYVEAFDELEMVGLIIPVPLELQHLNAKEESLKKLFSLLHGDAVLDPKLALEIELDEYAVERELLQTATGEMPGQRDYFYLIIKMGYPYERRRVEFF